MIKVLFICHGNICRSTMAEFLFKDMTSDLDNFLIDSKATSTEELGNDTYYKTKEILDKYHIKYTKRRASQITNRDYNLFDYIICMDDNNVRNLRYLIDDKSLSKVYKLKDFMNYNHNEIERLHSSDIFDPWYTRDFESCYREIKASLEGLLIYLKDKHDIDF